MIQFEHPWYLIGMILLPFIIWVHFHMLKSKKTKAMSFANFETLRRLDDHWFYSKNVGQLLLRFFFTILVVLAFSGPSFSYNTEGTDYNVVFGIDTSGSMLSKDIGKNRLDSVVISMDSFITDFEGSGKIGVISFGGMAYIEEQLTEDKELIINEINNIVVSRIPGTAIGDAIKTGVTMLITNPDRENAGDVLVLITDGQENQLKDEELEEILDYTLESDVVVNILGVGTEQGATSDFVGVGDALFTLNEDTLNRITNATGGTYIHIETNTEIQPGLEQLFGPQEIKKRIRIAPLLFIIAMMLLFVEWNFTTYFFRLFPD